MTQRQTGILAKNLDIIEQDFGKFTVKFPRMQLIVNLLPGGNRQGMFIDIGGPPLVDVIHLDHRRQFNVFG